MTASENFQVIIEDEEIISMLQKKRNQKMFIEISKKPNNIKSYFTKNPEILKLAMKVTNMVDQNFLENLKLETTKVLFVTSELDKNLMLSARNIPYTKVQKAPEFSVYDVINSHLVIFQKAAIQVVNEVLA